jgi:cell division protein FtsL
MLLLLLMGMLFSSVYPMRRYFAVRAQIRELSVEERALDERIERLSEKRGRLTTDQEVERIARERLGMVRPGEVPFVIVSPKSPAMVKRTVASDGLEPVSAPREELLLERWWKAVRRALR